MHCDANMPYTGDEAYIFVSYAHKDAEMVYPIMEELNRLGYRVWYDDGIAPGSEWPENIAQHLNRCALVLAFISPNAVDSHNCRREITFALSRQKEFLAIILRPTEMSLGMELQLSAQQCIRKYSYTSEEAFLNKLCSSTGMALCRSHGMSNESKAEISENCSQNQISGIQAAKTEDRTFIRKRNQMKPEKTMKSGKRRILALGGGCIVAAVLCVALSLYSTVQITQEKKVSIGETHLSLNNEMITQSTIQQINRLDDLSYLNLQNCVFEEGALSMLELPHQMRSLNIIDCSGIDELNFLTELEEVFFLTIKNSAITDFMFPELCMENLDSLDLSGNPEITNLTSFAKSEQIRKLNVSGTGISSLDSLPLDMLQTIDFSGTGVSDVSRLADIAGLSEIYGGETMVREIDVLAEMTTLTKLDFSGCGLSDMDCVFSSLRLKNIDLSNNNLTNISAFQDCTVLCHVDLSENQLTDISVLEKSADMLETLNLARNPLAEEQLQFLLDSINLVELYLDEVPLKKVDMLKNSTEMRVLSAMNCGLSDIGGLSGCTKLETLRLAWNCITDIEPLQGLTEDYITMDLGYNPIRDVSKLPQVNYRALSIISDELDLNTLPSLTGNTLALKYSEKIMDENFDAEAFSWYNILNVPNDVRVDLEDLLGTYGIRYIDSGDYALEQMKKDGLMYVPE